MVNAKVTLGNPVKEIVPSAPAPSHVGRPLPEQEPAGAVKKKTPEDKDVSKDVDVVKQSSGGVDEELQEKLDNAVDAKPKGTICISIYENSPYTVDFEGIVTGSELDLAWRAMMKEYRVWKHIMFKRIEQEKKDGGTES